MSPLTRVAGAPVQAEGGRLHRGRQLQRDRRVVLVGEVAYHTGPPQCPRVPPHVHVHEHDERLVPRRVVGDDQLEGVGLQSGHIER